MSYLHIDNLYRDTSVLLFKEGYVLEKIHGTSSHVQFATPPGTVTYFAGGEKHEKFVKLFDEQALLLAFVAIGHPEVIVYGEAYGGKCQGMSDTYGKDLRFIAFDVKIGDLWVDVPTMDRIVTGLGLESVPWKKVKMEIEILDAERDAPSEVAVRRGILESKAREGIVIRPLIELIKNNGARIIAKHKGKAFQERSTHQKITDPAEYIKPKSRKIV